MTARGEPLSPSAEPNVTPLIDVILVLVRVDGPVLYGRAVEAMDVSRAAGAQRIGLVGNGR
jgi:biopolymer transport protein ExbD